MWHTTYYIRTHSWGCPCAESYILCIILCILLKQAEIVWIIGASVWATKYAQSFTAHCQRLPHDGVSNSHNHLVLSWTLLSTSTKSTPSPDRLLSFDTFWLATHIVSGAGLVISSMLGFRSIASIFSANTAPGSRLFFWLNRLRHAYAYIYRI